MHAGLEFISCLLRTSGKRAEGVAPNKTVEHDVVSYLYIGSAAALCLLTLAITAAGADGAQIEVPLDLDYVLLDAALQQQLYTSKNGRAEFWKSPDNCGYFYGQNPRFSRKGSVVEFTTDAQLSAGIGVAGECLSAVQWSGIIDATTAPHIDGFVLKFRVTDIDVYNPGDAAGLIGGSGMDILKTNLIPRLHGFSYDLAPYVQQLNAVMNPVLANDAEAKSVLSSLRLAPEVVSLDDGIRLTLRMTVPERLLKPPPARSPTTAEAIAWRTAAGNVESLLDRAAAQIGPIIPDQQMRDQLANLVADIHRRFQDSQQRPVGRADPLPLFKQDWEKLRAFAKAATHRIGPNIKTMTVLSLVTAADAVFALDQKAPNLGERVSRAGLHELARLLGQPDSGASSLSSRNQWSNRLSRPILGLGHGSTGERHWEHPPATPEANGATLLCVGDRQEFYSLDLVKPKSYPRCGHRALWYGRLMRCNLLSVFERAAVLQVRGSPGRPKGVPTGGVGRPAP
jgi:hypothetical protein